MEANLPSNLTGMIDEAVQPVTLARAKQLTTDVGRTSAALTRQGKLREASIMNEPAKIACRCGGLRNALNQFAAKRMTRNCHVSGVRNQTILSFQQFP
jgi:hypothetical protein